MALMESAGPLSPNPTRPRIASHRASEARAMLADCHLCAHHCGVNRSSGEQGLCHAGTETRFFSAQVDVAEELALIPAFALALSGCDLRCDFCITGASSWNVRAGVPLDLKRVADSALDALARGASTIMILGGEPTIHLPAVLDLVALLPAEARLVWKTNAHGSAIARELLDGMFDVWVADYKFGNDACASRLARVPGYLHVVHENLLWAHEHADLFVRHLLMPGHVDCCWTPTARWLASHLPGVKVSLRSGFWPAWQVFRHPELHGVVSPVETERAWRIGTDLALNLIE